MVEIAVGLWSNPSLATPFFMHIYIDESGYTGEDLLNSEQPILVLSSTTLANDVTEQLISKSFAGSKAAELKHSVLGSRRSGQDRIVQFVQELNRQKSVAGTYIVHKKYGLVTKMVDLWVEPAMRHDGIDLYNRGANIALSNLIYSILDSLLPDFDQHLLRFQTMMRKRTQKSYREFWNPIYKLCRDKKDGPVTDTLLYLLGGEMRLGFQYLLTRPAHALDLALTCSLQIVDHWHDTTDETLFVIHDESSAMAREKWIWDIIVSPEVPKIEVGYDRRKTRFPLNVVSTEPASSKNHLQLQIADVLAGATAMYGKSLLRSARQTEYADKLKDAGIREFLINIFWPSKDIAPEDLDTTGENSGDAIEFMAELLRQAKKSL